MIINFIKPITKIENGGTFENAFIAWRKEPILFQAKKVECICHKNGLTEPIRIHLMECPQRSGEIQSEAVQWSWGIYINLWIVTIRHSWKTKEPPKLENENKTY